jgi:hypothetical protein
MLKSGLKITIDNVDRFLKYHEVYSILIYVKYSYVVRNLTDYLTDMFVCLFDSIRLFTVTV